MCVVALNASRNSLATLNVHNGQRWGDWHDAEFCPEGQFAYAYTMKIEGKQGNDDDTSLNGIQLHCGTPIATTTNRITSGQGPWGDWKQTTSCSRTGDFLTAFSLQVEANQGSGDDTAANFVKFQCRGYFGEYELSQYPGHGLLGNFGDWSPSCPIDSAICGLRTKIEPRQGKGDDTALNDVEFFCCLTNGIFSK